MTSKNHWLYSNDEKENMEEIEDEEEFDEMPIEENMENAKTIEEEDEPDFLDNSGQLWEFVCRIEDGQDLGEFMGKMEGMMIKKEDNNKWNKFGCADNDGACPFQAIFLKSCSNLYSREEHNHGYGHENFNEKVNRYERIIQNEKENVKEKTHYTTRKLPLDIGDDYVDYLGRSWKFFGKIGDEIPNPSRKQLRAAFGFARIFAKQTTWNMYCWKFGQSGRKCKFSGVYLLANRCAYTRGEHECDEKQYCSNSNLYSRGTHNHEAKKESNEKDGQNAEFKKIARNIRLPSNYRLFCQINNEEDLQKVLKENLLVQDKMYNEGARYNYGCKWNSKTRNMHQRPAICKFRGIYDQKSGNFYLKNAEHVHNIPKENEAEKEVSSKIVGKAFEFHPKICKNDTNEIMPSKKELKQNSPSQSLSEKVARPKKWKTSKNSNDDFVDDFEEDDHSADYENEHKQLEVINIGNHDFFDKFGNSWPFVVQISKNIPKDQFGPRFGITGVQRTKYGFFLGCSKMGKGTNGRCRFRAIYVESTGCLYAKSTKHDHTGAFDFKMLKNKKEEGGNE